MLPEVIIHNTLSLDNAYYGFDIDLGAHYSVLTGFKPDAVLVGSDTAKTGVEMFFDPVPEERDEDLTRPDASLVDRTAPDRHGGLLGVAAGVSTTPSVRPFQGVQGRWRA